MKTNNPSGRGKGNLNKLTKREKETLYDALKGELEGAGKYIQSLSVRDRAKYLLKFLPYLVSPSNENTVEDEISNKVQEILFKKLVPEYKKIDIYFHCIPQNERANLLLSILSLFTPKQRTLLLSYLEKNRNLL